MQHRFYNLLFFPAFCIKKESISSMILYFVPEVRRIYVTIPEVR